MGMGAPANDVLGAGPIAAPTATPMASIPAANAALARSEGRRGARWGCAVAAGGASAPIGESRGERGSVASAALVDLLAADEVPCALVSGGVGVSGGVVIGSVA
jgi:hypothetical protein